MTDSTPDARQDAMSEVDILRHKLSVFRLAENQPMVERYEKRLAEVEAREIARLTMRVTELEDDAECAAIDRALLEKP